MDEISVKLNEFPTIHVSLGNVNISQHPKPTSHSLLENRDLADQHPISAITGLGDALDSKIEQKELDSAVDSALGAAKERGDFDGKTAYEYAQDAGYTGSEAEFAEKLAAECSSVHIGPTAPEEEADLWIDTDEKEEEKPKAPDFSANEGEDGYIENRTHFVDKNGVIHKLDNKYIDADWIATSEDGGAGKTVFIPEQTVTGSMWNEPMQETPEEGSAYAVEVNGILYRCVCHSYDGTLYLGNGSLLGDNTTEHNNEPFCISWFSAAASGAFYTDGTLEAPIGIKVSDWRDTIYNKLPEEYLPDNVVKGENGKVSWDNVSGKPFTGGAGELLFSHTVTFATASEAKSGTPVSNVSLALVDGAEYWLDVNGGMSKVRCEKNSVLYPLFDSEGNMWLRCAGKVPYVYGQSAGTYAYNLYGLSEDMVLDPQYIPPNVAQKKDIPETSGGGVDATASVGQTIRVKTVDAEGKPTEWEAVDYQPRTHWTEETVLLPETTGEVTADGQLELPYIQFANGVEYKVVYNGVEYILNECLIFDEDDGTMYILGNIPAVVETGDNGVPFAILAIFDEVNGSMASIVPLDGSTTVTLSITEVKHTPIPMQYVSNAFPYYIEVVAETYVDSSTPTSYTCADTVANVEAALAHGRDVKVKLTVTGNNSSPFQHVYNLALYGLYENQYKLGFATPIALIIAKDTLYLVAQEDGTFAVSTTLD